MKKISILVPAYNEEKALPFFKERIIKIIEAQNQYEFEVFFVDDGSSDNTVELIKEMREQDKRFNYISLSRNYGKEIAVAAGFDQVKESDATILIDADLQDPPELIPKLIEQWENGYDDVYAKRTSREGETFLKKFTSKMYYRVLQGFANNIKIQEDTGDFRLLDKRCVQALCKMKEENRCSKSLFSLIGFNKKEVLFERDKRIAGNTKWNYRKLITLAVDGITAFTFSPLRWATYVSILTFLAAFVYLVTVLITAHTMEGYQILLTVILVLAGIQFLITGLIGEYIGRIFKETKKRPLYFIKEVNGEKYYEKEKIHSNSTSYNNYNTNSY